MKTARITLGGGADATRADVAELAALLQETSEHHDAGEPLAPAHYWWDFDAAHMVARMHERAPEAAPNLAVHYMAAVTRVVLPTTPIPGVSR